MAAPLTENTRGRHQQLEGTLDCQTAFMGLKEALTSAPVLRHFNPALCTAVHIYGRQWAVKALLLQ